MDGDYQKDLLLFIYYANEFPFTDSKELIRDWHLPKDDLRKVIERIELQDQLIQSNWHGENWKKYFIISPGVSLSFDQCTFSFRLLPEGKRYIQENYFTKMSTEQLMKMILTELKSHGSLQLEKDILIPKDIYLSKEQIDDLVREMIMNDYVINFNEPAKKIMNRLTIQGAGVDFLFRIASPSNPHHDYSQHVHVQGDLSGQVLQSSGDSSSNKTESINQKIETVKPNKNNPFKKVFVWIFSIVAGLIVAYIAYKMRWI